MVSSFTPCFNIAMVALFPYMVCFVVLGTPQITLNSKLMLISYEMYLVGWPIQQVVLQYHGEMSPIKNVIFTIPLDIILGLCLYGITEWLLKLRKKSN